MWAREICYLIVQICVAYMCSSEMSRTNIEYDIDFITSQVETYQKHYKLGREALWSFHC